jgi:hypothetical protein
MRVNPVNKMSIDGAIDSTVSAAMMTTALEGLCKPPRLMLTDGFPVAMSDDPIIARSAETEIGSRCKDQS